MIITKQKKQSLNLAVVTRVITYFVLSLPPYSQSVLQFALSNFESIMNKNNNKLTRRTKKKI